VGEWLSSFGLGEHAASFETQRIDGQALLFVAEELATADWGVATQICDGLNLLRVGEVCTFRARLRKLLDLESDG